MELTKMLKISIITINYNNLDGLKRTLKSVIQQSYLNFEYVIIDGGSDDGSQDFILKHDQDIDYWRSESDQGVYHAMNKGIKQATGDYLLFLNSGDCLHDKNVLESVSRQMQTGMDLYYGNEVKANGQLWRIPEKLSLSYFFESSLRHQATFIKKSLFETVGHYDESLKIVSDWAFMLEAIFIYGAKTQFVELIISSYEGGGISQQPCNLELRQKERDQQLKKLFPLIYSDMKLLESYKQQFKNPRVWLLMRAEKYSVLTFLNRIYFRVLVWFLPKV